MSSTSGRVADASHVDPALLTVTRSADHDLGVMIGAKK
jgi:hypothetical protein